MDAKPRLTADERSALARALEGVCAAALRNLRVHPCQNDVIQFVSTVQQAVDKAFRERVQRGVKPACKAGCSHCCNARVEAMPAEVFRIARHLRQSGQALEPLLERLDAQIAGSADALAWRDRTACAFLVHGLCSIYDVRPGVCRKGHSMDVARCEAGASAIPEDLGLVLDAEVLIKGAANAYEQLGYESKGVELARAMRRVLADSTAEDRWYNRERVFHPEPAA